MAFETKKGQFNVALLDGVFVAVSKDCYKDRNLVSIKLSEKKLNQLEADDDFIEAITHSTSHTTAVKTRINKAIEILL